jgi:type II secretory pathway pseudopilin PulG
MIELMLSIAVLAAFALSVGGVWLIAKKRDRKRGLLMLGAALVTFANVLILAWPAH